MSLINKNSPFVIDYQDLEFGGRRTRVFTIDADTANDAIPRISFGAEGVAMALLGTVTINGSPAPVAGDLTLTGDLEVQGSSTVDDLDVGGDATVAGTLAVTGASTLAALTAAATSVTTLACTTLTATGNAALGNAPADTIAEHGGVGAVQMAFIATVDDDTKAIAFCEALRLYLIARGTMAAS